MSNGHFTLYTIEYNSGLFYFKPNYVCLPCGLSGSFIIGTLLFVDVCCSFCRNSDVVAICLSASMPSFTSCVCSLGFWFCVPFENRNNRCLKKKKIIFLPVVHVRSIRAYCHREARKLYDRHRLLHFSSSVFDD